MRAANERLVGLLAAGAQRLDGPGIKLVEGLLSRANELGGAAAERLRGRASARLDRIEVALERARVGAAAALADVSDGDGALRALFDAGDFTAVMREAKRARRRAQRIAAKAPAEHRVLRLARQAKARGVRLPAPVLAAVATVEAGEHSADSRTLGDDLARRLFQDAALQARSALMVAQAVDDRPKDAGPYNAKALVGEALALMDAVSPVYLRAYLSALEDLSALRMLPTAPRRKRGRR